MTDRFDAVAIGIAQEGAVIGRVVLAHARPALVAAASSNAGVPERIDLLARFGLEAPMAAIGLLRLRPLADGEIDTVRMRRPRPFAIAEPVLAASDLHDVERLHDRIIEALGGGNVRDRDGDVVKHRRSAAVAAPRRSWRGVPEPPHASPSPLR